MSGDMQYPNPIETLAKRLAELDEWYLRLETEQTVMRDELDKSHDELAAVFKARIEHRDAIAGLLRTANSPN